jgi:hypothetical protein
MTALEKYHAQRDWLELWAPSIELAKAIAQTDFVPSPMRGNPAAIAAAILYGDEVGLGPMQSLAKVAVIDGRPALYAEAQRALVFQAGHELWITEATNTRASWTGRRRDAEETSSVTWTMDDAKRAGLAGKRNWRLYPRAMLINRASAELCRALFPDAIGGLAAIEELEDVAEEVATGDEPPASATTKRRRRRAPLAAVSAPAAEPAPSPPLPPLPGEEEDAATEPGPPHSEAGSRLDDALEPSAAGPPARPEEGRAGAMTEGADVTSSPEPELITGPQRRKMMAAYREAGFEERDARLAFAAAVVGHSLQSSNDLTVEEAGQVIEALEGHVAGP